MDQMPSVRSSLAWKAPDKALIMTVDTKTGAPIFAGGIGGGLIVDVLEGRVLIVESEMAHPSYVLKIDDKGLAYQAGYGVFPHEH